MSEHRCKRAGGGASCRGREMRSNQKIFKIFLFGFLWGNQATKCKQTPFSPITRVERIIVDFGGPFWCQRTNWRGKYQC